MTPAIAKTAFVVLAVGWYLIRYEYARGSRRAPVVRSARGPRETALLLISLAGLGIVPFTYIATGIPHFADYSFHPCQAWFGIIVVPAWRGLFLLTCKGLGRNCTVSLDLREGHEWIT